MPEGNRRDHNIVRVSSFASKELSWHKRSSIVLVVLVRIVRGKIANQVADQIADQVADQMADK